MNAAARGGVELSEPAEGEAAVARDVAFKFFKVDWRAAQARGMHFAQDRLAASLVNAPRVRRLIIGEPYRSAPVAAVRALQAKPGSRPQRPETWCVSPLRVRRRDPRTTAGLARTYAAYDRRLERAIKRHGLRQPVLITADPFLAAYGRLTWASNVTFYATDDWPTAYDHLGYRAAFEDAFNRIGERGHRVCAVSSVILDRMSANGASEVVPNGVDASEWLRPCSAPDWLMQLPAPRVVYVGTLDSRLDPQLVAATARVVAPGTLLLLGATFDQAHVAKLAELPNVTVHHAVGRREISAVLRSADASVIPHVDMPFTQAMSPLKLYEAVAAGLPVVATDLAPMRGVHPSVYLTKGTAEFADAVQSALRRERIPEAERARFIASNSWQARHEALLDFALGGT